jgi:hypothetical protein
MSVGPDESNACPAARQRNSPFGLLRSARVLFLFYADSPLTRKEGVPKYVSQVLIKYGTFPTQGRCQRTATLCRKCPSPLALGKAIA